jgi:acetyl esterase/lipase
LYKDALNAAVRSMLDRLTIADSRYLNVQTNKGYVQLYCKPRGLEPKTLRLDTADGRAVAHWIGDPDADAVILYCHGGGYTQPANEGNFGHLPRLVEDLNSDEGKPSISVLLLAYTLVPEAVYPTQLREAAVVLAHLVHSTGRSPSKVFIAGDSAGGNLVFSLLSHILHPHPDVSALKFESPLGGALLVSPWVSFRTDYPSFSSNATLDLLTPLSLRKWSAMFLNRANASDPESDPGLRSGDAWAEACLNPSSWWTGMDQVVSDVFVWWGGYEVFVDPIRELEKNFKAGWTEGGGEVSRTIFLESAKEAHTAPIVDTMIPGAEKGDAQALIEEWFKGRLQQ